MTIRPWRPLRRLAVLLLALTAAVSSDLSGQGRRARASVMVDGREAVDGEVLVRFRSAAAAFEQSRAAEEVEADEVEPVGRRGTRRMRARRLGTHELLARLRANPDVEFVEPNYIIRLVAAPNDPSFGDLWGLFNFGQNYGGVGIAGADIDATLAWDVTTGTRANVVGIVDTGIDYNHPDLAANIWTAPSAFSVTIGGVVINCAAGTHGFNAIANTCDPMDDNNHGTHVAGTIGAVGNNGVGVAGVNWTASMMGLKFLSASGSGTTANAIKAIEFAVQAKAVLGTAAANLRVLSNSWGGGGYSQSLLDEINRANTYDMLFVAAAGNSGLNADVSPVYPAAYSAPNIISVAATDNRDQRAWFSNYGAATVHLGAPGVAVLSTTRNNSYSSFSGTSMATPHVAGAAALLLAACPMTTAALKATVLNTVDPIAAMSGISITGGRLNIDAAVRACTPPPQLTVNGQAGPVTVAAGSTITVGVSNGPGNRADFVMLVPAGSVAEYWSGNYQYLSGSTTRPATGLTTATLTFTAPAAGAFEFRFFRDDRWARLATSRVVTVAP
ncbi:MAG: S8 family peptidase [Vicinamibacterales bacterium]|jgi:subtilisin family serine protease